MFLQDFSFKLPKELIATKPAYPRDSSRLLFLKNKGSYEETLTSIENGGDTTPKKIGITLEVIKGS